MDCSIFQQPYPIMVHTQPPLKTLCPPGFHGHHNYIYIYTSLLIRWPLLYPKWTGYETQTKNLCNCCWSIIFLFLPLQLTINLKAQPCEFFRRLRELILYRCQWVMLQKEYWGTISLINRGNARTSKLVPAYLIFVRFIKASLVLHNIDHTSL